MAKATSAAKTKKGEYLHDMEVEKYLADCVRVYADTPEMLQEEFVRIPADLAYWNCRYAEALRRFLQTKRFVAQNEAEARIVAREALAALGGRVTESMVDAEVEKDEHVIKTREDLLEAEVSKVHVYGIVDAIRAKKDMLVSLGAQYRAEMAGDPTLRERNRAAREVGG
jgi:hypothetical protein